MDPLSVVARPSAACVSFLSEDLKYHQPVTSLSWNPQGSLLLSSSAADNTMYVWNTASELKVPVKRISGGGIHLAKWSPVGSAVMSATTSTVFRIWNTSNWLPERWNVLSGHINRYILVLNQKIEFRNFILFHFFLVFAGLLVALQFYSLLQKIPKYTV